MLLRIMSSSFLLSVVDIISRKIHKFKHRNLVAKCYSSKESFVGSKVSKQFLTPLHFIIKSFRDFECKLMHKQDCHGLHDINKSNQSFFTQEITKHEAQILIFCSDHIANKKSFHKFIHMPRRDFKNFTWKTTTEKLKKDEKFMIIVGMNMFPVHLCW